MLGPIARPKTVLRIKCKQLQVSHAPASQLLALIRATACMLTVSACLIWPSLLSINYFQRQTCLGFLQTCLVCVCVLNDTYLIARVEATGCLCATVHTLSCRQFALVSTPTFSPDRLQGALNLYSFPLLSASPHWL